MAAVQSAHAVVGLTGIHTGTRALGLNGERYVHIELPATIDEAHLQKMMKDLDVIRAVAEKDPKRMVELLNAAQRHDFGKAQGIANDTGLNEENMRKQGGGQVGVAVAILVVLVVAAIVLSSDSGGGSSEPVGPNPGDAGANG